MRPETQKASAPVRERWQGFLFGRLVLCGFRRQDVPAQVLLKLEGELVILLQTVEIGVGGGLFFLLLNDADRDVGAMIAHTLGIVQQIVEDEAELDGALAALEPPDVTLRISSVRRSIVSSRGSTCRAIWGSSDWKLRRALFSRSSSREVSTSTSSRAMVEKVNCFS